ncbi:protein misato homolog 1-like isoform X2 [Uloborus diversus]|uniref:protein misato homolog 1-like isoform X2 n=1 Tax=Uloborus diversus TaxID=327109 RepID=UPI002409B84A|nr:protein misato homolog 1-like isoform X2 [Uloborus diversus]
MSSHEIVTIQAGCFSNFIGTHWWNMQESSFCYDPRNSADMDIDHDVLFREGLNLQQEVTYTPRLVLLDLKGNLQSISTESPLYRNPHESKNETLWEGAVDVVKQSSKRKNPFLEESNETPEKSEDLNIIEAVDSDSTAWSDYLKTNLHPRSFCLFQENSSSDSGDEVYMETGKDMVENALRKTIEECDYLQGFNFIFDAHNGFSAICNHVLQHLDDEYSRSPSLCFPVFQDHKTVSLQDVRKQLHRLFAVTTTLSNLNSFATCFSPLSLCDDVVRQTEPFRKFPYLQYNGNRLYHSSAIFATAIETLTSQCRLKRRKFSLSDVTSGMSMYSRKLVCSNIALPFPLAEDAYLSCMVRKDVPEYFPVSLSPFHDPGSEKNLFQSAVLRGIPHTKFQKRDICQQSILPVEEVFADYLKIYSASYTTTATVFSEKISVDSPFPKIFSELVGTTGILSSAANNKSVDKVPVAASFSSSNSAATFIEDLLSQVSKTNFKEYVKSAESSFEKDEFQEVLQNVISLQDNYQNY